MQELFLTNLKKEYQRIGFEMKASDAHMTITWRYRLLKFLCWIGDKGCTEKATQKYQENIDDLSRFVSIYLRAIIFDDFISTFNITRVF